MPTGQPSASYDCRWSDTTVSLITDKGGSVWSQAASVSLVHPCLEPSGLKCVCVYMWQFSLLLVFLCFHSTSVLLRSYFAIAENS